MKLFIKFWFGLALITWSLSAESTVAHGQESGKTAGINSSDTQQADSDDDLADEAFAATDEAELKKITPTSKFKEIIVFGVKVKAESLGRVEFPSHLKELTIAGFKRIEPKNFPRISHLKQLQYLSIQRAEVSDKCLMELKQLTELRRLLLPFTNITDATLSGVSNLPKLESLMLPGTKISDDGLSKLAGLKKLKSLWVDRTALTDKAAQHLSKMTQLESLFLDGTKITEKGLGQLESLQSLKVLSIPAKITDNAATSLAKLAKLELLYVGTLDDHLTAPEAALQKKQYLASQAALQRLQKENPKLEILAGIKL